VELEGQHLTKKEKKGGAGKGNWGRNDGKGNREEAPEADNEQNEEEETAEEKGMTLDEYYASKGSNKFEAKLNETKKVTQE